MLTFTYTVAASQNTPVWTMPRPAHNARRRDDPRRRRQCGRVDPAGHGQRRLGNAEHRHQYQDAERDGFRMDFGGLEPDAGQRRQLAHLRAGTMTDAVTPCPPASLTNIEITSPSSAAGNLTVNSTGNPIPAGGLTYSGAGGLIITGSGSVTLSGTDTYSGGTAVVAGTLIVTTSSALPSGGAHGRQRRDVQLRSRGGHGGCFRWNSDHAGRCRRSRSGFC